MVEFFKNIFAGDVLPQGGAFLWLNVISDLVIALAYYAIPVLLIRFARRPRDLRFSRILLAFGAFGLVCGSTHLLSAWTVWHAAYRLDGIVKAAVALVSVVTVLMLLPLLPSLVKLSNPAELALEINHDLSAPKNLEHANAKFRQLLESAPDGMVVVDRDGAILQTNSQTERLFGYTREELSGQPVEMLLPDQFRHIHAAHRVEYFEAPKARPMGAGLDLKGRRKDGTEFPVEISLSPIETEEGLQVIGSVRDVSERKQFERALQDKNTELEKALATKELFLASMSHELRTPLNAVLGFAGTLLMRLPGPLTEAQERQVLRIQAAGKHLLTLISDVLDLAKVESGAVEIQRTETSCREVLKEVEAVVAPIAEAKSVVLEVDLPEPSVRIKTHPQAFTQILVTLAQQAVKYSEHGSLRIGTSEASRGSQEMMAVYVKQTAGLKPRDQEWIRQVFERVRQGGPPDGSELGLYLCGRLADLIGGVVEVETEPDAGSRLTLLVPKA